ncbi:MAG: hypothetical protein P4L81_03985, partial [Candidatus Pacebacteria bacterium]|nr:hypothetical protein [Candidatus Paceibacterota bacterium]
MTVWIVICLASLVILAIRLRNRGCSLGMPIAYLLLLDLNHVPGTLASQFSGVILYNSDETSIGIYFTSIGAVAFVVGAWIGNLGGTTASRTRREDDVFFRLFCLTGGAVLVTALSLIPTIPTLTAALYYGADIWLLPVILGLLASVRQAELRRSLYWIGSLFVYPLWGLLTGGFLSYGATTVAIGLAPIVMVARSSLKLTIGSVLALFLGLTVFVNYFAG